MLDNFFPFMDSTELIVDDMFSFADQVESLLESPEDFVVGNDVKAALSSKVVEIITVQWGQQMEDLQDLYVGQFQERIEKGEEVMYKPTNRYILRAKFPYAREPRSIIFTLST